MATTGCDFICKNDECKHKGSGIVLTSPWPLGDIDMVINSKNVSKNSVFKQELQNLKEQGRKYACISLPNSENIPVVGYRVHMWCEKCPCLWSYDAMIPDDVKEDVIESSIRNANIPTECPNCKEKLKTFMELIQENSEGISCTSCKSKLSKNVWFSNEEGPSDKLNSAIKLPSKE